MRRRRKKSKKDEKRKSRARHVDKKEKDGNNRHRRASVERMASIERKSRKLEPGVTKLVVFDFDQTISIVHMFHILFGQGCPSEPLQVAAIQNPEKVSTEKSPVTFCESLLGGQDRVKRLRHVLEALHKSKVEMMICTFGHCDAVRELFITLKLDHLFTRIYGNGVFNKNTDKNVNGEREFCKKYPLPPTSKMGVMSGLRQEFDLSYDATLFIDDDKNNILMCQGVCRTMYIPKREGLTKDMLDDLEHLASVCSEDKVDFFKSGQKKGWWKDPAENSSKSGSPKNRFLWVGAVMVPALLCGFYIFKDSYTSWLPTFLR